MRMSAGYTQLVLVLCICFALVALIDQSHATASTSTSSTSTITSSGSSTSSVHTTIIPSSLVHQQGEAMLAQIKRSSACSFNGVDFSSLTHYNGTDYNYSTSPQHYTWYADLIMMSSVVACLTVSVSRSVSLAIAAATASSCRPRPRIGSSRMACGLFWNCHQFSSNG